MTCVFYSPDDIKKGIRKRPDKTRSRNDCNVDPSKGKAPQTRTYKTTPNDCKKQKRLIYFTAKNGNLLSTLLAFNFNLPRHQFQDQHIVCLRKPFQRK